MGVEIDPRLASLAAQSTGREIITGDFMDCELPAAPTLLLGNPPFKMVVIDGFLDRAQSLLPEEGRVGFILPAYALQTAKRVVRYSSRWSLFQEMIPRNIYPGLSKPLVFAIFTKSRERILVGFAFYHEADSVNRLPKMIRDILVQSEGGSVWRRVVEAALKVLGGEADLQTLYQTIEPCRPTENPKWREKIRQTLQRHEGKGFLKRDRAIYSLAPSRPQAA
jgi:site-specific DNA-methyltransferase (adenine-specific)